MKVSVATTTYNHEKFIVQALESVLMQKVNFDYEFVIVEDCSTDRTREIVIDYQSRYPDVIRLILPEVNKGENWTWIKSMEACQGEYIALFHGDDYWTSADKLQKQVDFLDHHPECSLCFHNALFIYEDQNHSPHNFCFPEQKRITTTEDLLETNYINTSSVMFRNGLVTEFPEWYYKLPVGDFPLFILLSEHGKIGYIDKVMTAYRVHPAGSWSGSSFPRRIQNYFIVRDTINAYFRYQYDDIIMKAKDKNVDHLAIDLIRQTAINYSLEHGMTKIHEVFEDWPDGVPLNKTWEKRVLGKFCAYYLFASHKSQDFGVMRSSFVNLLRNDPSWLKNRYVWSAGMQAFLGRKVSAMVRQRVRWIKARTAKNHT